MIDIDLIVTTSEEQQSKLQVFLDLIFSLFTCSLGDLSSLPERLYSKEVCSFLTYLEYLGVSKVENNRFGESRTLATSRK